MKKTLTILWAVMAAIVCQAQNDSRVLRPAELVSQHKNGQYGDFERVPVFSAWTAARNVDPVLGIVKKADIDQEQLQQVLAKAPERLALQLPQPGGSMVDLELVRVNPLSDDFSVIESVTNSPVQIDPGVHYRGIVKGDPQSVAAISFFDNDVMGLLSSPAMGNLVLGKMETAEKNGEAPYIVYKDDGLFASLGFYCGVDDDGPGYAPHELHGSVDPRSAGDCVRIYFEVDNDIVVNKGGVTGATNYVTGIFNQVATLYANDNISVVISQIFVWNAASPYNSTSSAGMLTQFQNYRTSFNGDLAQLLSFKASGGIAVLSGLCHPYIYARMSFASINASYANVPAYSFTVLVVTHELGHLLGSHHTHACVWNGNNTAIDGCSGFSEGNCAVGPIPSNGGTIMSYCHITSTGINLSKGFGPQPGNVIRNRIASATCTQACSTGGGGTGGGGTGGGGSDPDCDEYKLFLTLTLDDFGTETTWKIKPAGDTTVLFSGGPYAKGLAGTTVRDTFCVPQGCYDFVVMDSYGDGLCCNYGQGSYSLKDEDNNVLAAGGSFGFEEMKNVCLPYEAGDDTPCVLVNFNNQAITPFGTGNDFGTYQLLNNGVVLKIQNNAWKTIALNYTVTPNTIMEFEFGSTIQGEIHGIGFDNDDFLSYNTTFKLHGIQNWGILNYDNYPGGSIWLKYTIPVGQFFTGAFNKLVFAADNDSGNYSGNSYFRYIKIYEGVNGCEGNLAEGDKELLAEEFAAELNVYPNPTPGALQVAFEGWQGPVNLRVYNALGQLVQQQTAGLMDGIFTETLNLGHLPQGAYYLQADNGQEVQSSTFVISKN